MSSQIDAGKMAGFVRAYQATYPEAQDLDPGDVMLQLGREHQPMTYFLAEEFTICNRWFSAVPTDTIPNRLYSLAGTAGRVTSTSASIDLAEIPALDSIFEQLDPEHWRLFSGSIPLAFAVSPIRTVGLDADRWHTLSEFADYVPKLPKLTWIDPTYYWLDVADGLPRRLAHVDAKFPIPNDDHPPSQTERGQELLRYVYESLTAHPEVWANTVLIVTYDEHGGFFDHVEPPPIPSGGARARRLHASRTARASADRVALRGARRGVQRAVRSLLDLEVLVRLARLTEVDAAHRVRASRERRGRADQERARPRSPRRRTRSRCRRRDHRSIRTTPTCPASWPRSRRRPTTTRPPSTRPSSPRRGTARPARRWRRSGSQRIVTRSTAPSNDSPPIVR